MTKIDDYRQTIKGLDDWVPFLLKESGLPGPRGNLELAHAVALAEPRLLKQPKHAKQVLQILDRITASMEAEQKSRDEAFKVLRQGMGYCWSVAVAALPEEGKPIMECWLGSEDPDIRWMMKENLKKNRLVKMDADWVKTCMKKLG